MTNRSNTYKPKERTAEEVKSEYDKKLNQITGYLKGKGFNKALEVFEFAKSYHKGVRKNGFTPEFQHQIEIALHVQTFKEIRHEEETFCAVFLHDLMEDYVVSKDVIEAKFGDRVADAVYRLSKKIKYDGSVKTKEEYFTGLAECPIASIVKLADRANNLSSMLGVFSIEKQRKYLIETEEWFIPLAKKSRKTFPDQSASYHNAATNLKMVSTMLHGVLAAEEILIEMLDENNKPKIIKP